MYFPSLQCCHPLPIAIYILHVRSVSGLHKLGDVFQALAHALRPCVSRGQEWAKALMAILGLGKLNWHRTRFGSAGNFQIIVFE